MTAPHNNRIHPALCGDLIQCCRNVEWLIAHDNPLAAIGRTYDIEQRALGLRLALGALLYERAGGVNPWTP